MAGTRSKAVSSCGWMERMDGTDGWNDNNITPLANIGAGNFPSPVDTVNFTTIGTVNSTLARNIIYNLSGSINDIRQGFDLTSSQAPYVFKGYHIRTAWC